MPVPLRPPWVVTSQPDGVGCSPSGTVRASTDSTMHCDPKRRLISPSTSGRAIAAVLTLTLSAPARQHGVDIADGADAAAHRERDEHLVGGAFDHVHHGGPARAGRGDIEEREFVGALAVVAFGQFDGIAGVAQVLEIDALDDATVVDVGQE